MNTHQTQTNKSKSNYCSIVALDKKTTKQQRKITAFRPLSKQSISILYDATQPLRLSTPCNHTLLSLHFMIVFVFLVVL